MVLVWIVLAADTVCLDITWSQGTTHVRDVKVSLKDAILAIVLHSVLSVSLITILIQLPMCVLAVR